MVYQKHFWIHIPFIGSMLDRIKPVLIYKSTATRSYHLKATPYSTLFGRAYGPGPFPVAVAAVILRSRLSIHPHPWYFTTGNHSDNRHCQYIYGGDIPGMPVQPVQ